MYIVNDIDMDRIEIYMEYILLAKDNYFHKSNHFCLFRILILDINPFSEIFYDKSFISFKVILQTYEKEHLSHSLRIKGNKTNYLNCC